MTNKKKLLIALLSTACLTAGACGIAACKKDEKDPDQPPAANYAYTVTAKDNNNNPVKDVWFKIGYVDRTIWKFVPVTKTVDGKQVTLVAKSGEDGKAGFDFEPQEGITYQVQLANPEDIGNNSRSYPYGYKAITSSAVYPADTTSIEYSFEYMPNGYYENDRKTLNYKRIYDEETKGVKEIKDENKLTLTKDRYSYFVFQSYEALKGGGEQADELRTLYTQAAAGVYEISYSTTSSANITMFNFSATEAFCSVDSEGKPTAKIDTVTSSESKITLSLTVYGNLSRAVQYFAIYADADCEVTINAVRKGDAKEPVIVETEDAEFTTPASKFENQPGKKLSLMPLDGNLEVVKGDDGYYHVGSKNGPLLLVNLTKTISRAGETSIQQLPSASGRNVFVVGKYEGNTLVSKIDYSKLVNAYCAKVNSDGVYPVNDDLYTFLEEFKSQWITSVNSQYDWLIPCQYYAPEDGFEAKGEGTEEKPFVLLEGKSKLSNTGASTWVSYTATMTGVYSFNPASGELAVPNGVISTTKNGLLYITLKEGETVKMQLNSASANTSVETVSAANGVLEASTREVKDAEGNTIVEPGPGSSATDALSVYKLGLFAYVIDENLTENGLYIKIPAIVDGTYTLNVYGEGASVTLNGEAVSTITAVGGTDYVLLLDAPESGVYMLEIAFVADNSENSYTIKFEDSYTSTLFEFTAAVSGWYKFMLPENSPIDYIEFNGKQMIKEEFDANNEFVGYSFVSFYIEEGETFEFYLSSNKSGSYSFWIVEGEPEETVKLKIGESVNVTVPSGMDGCITNVTVPKKGTYSFEIEASPMISQTNFEIYVYSSMSAMPAKYTISATTGFKADVLFENNDGNNEYEIVICSSNMNDLDIRVTINEKTA